MEGTIEITNFNQVADIFDLIPACLYDCTYVYWFRVPTPRVEPNLIDNNCFPQVWYIVQHLYCRFEAGQVKPNTINLVFAMSPLSMKHEDSGGSESI